MVTQRRRWIRWLAISVALASVPGTPCMAEEAPSGRAVVKVDCSKTRGELSPYVLGTTAGPGFDGRAAELLKEAGFKLVESGSWSGGRLAIEGAMECPSVQVWVLRREE